VVKQRSDIRNQMSEGGEEVNRFIGEEERIHSPKNLRGYARYPFVSTKILTISGSKCLPAHLRSSSMAVSFDRPFL
jgi:hypothetical protein